MPGPQRAAPPPEDEPLVWCFQVFQHFDDGNFEATANAQRELARLGWELRRISSRRRKPAAPRMADAGRESRP